ncbi:MAG: hypothetical protein NWF01_07885 [Candidatus Bathyarchaeota archaeon]|nr:hypothetical protein [Candidatus Bathyarchaeota archaeon]
MDEPKPNLPPEIAQRITVIKSRVSTFYLSAADLIRDFDEVTKILVDENVRLRKDNEDLKKGKKQ